jgi:DNA-binding IclR family transcriptional regulator
VEIAAAMTGYEKSEVAQLLSEMTDEGLVYCTHDELHLKLA